MTETKQNEGKNVSSAHVPRDDPEPLKGDFLSSWEVFGRPFKFEGGPKMPQAIQSGHFLVIRVVKGPENSFRRIPRKLSKPNSISVKRWPFGTGKVWFLIGTFIKIQGFAILETSMFYYLLDPVWPPNRYEI